MHLSGSPAPHLLPNFDRVMFVASSDLLRHSRPNQSRRQIKRVGYHNPDRLIFGAEENPCLPTVPHTRAICSGRNGNDAWNYSTILGSPFWDQRFLSRLMGCVHFPNINGWR